MVHPKGMAPATTPLMEVVYDGKPVKQWDSFDVIRQRVNTEWHRLPKKASVISASLQDKIDAFKPLK